METSRHSFNVACNKYMDKLWLNLQIEQIFHCLNLCKAWKTKHLLNLSMQKLQIFEKVVAIFSTRVLDNFPV